jgi:hypothetical protein
LLQKRRVQENQARLKFNSTHQLLAYADDVKIVGENRDTVKENTEALLDASKEVGVEVNRAKILMSRYKNLGPKHRKRERTGPLKLRRSSNVWE